MSDDVIDSTEYAPEKKGDPQVVFLGFHYLSNHYAQLCKKIGEFLTSEKDLLEADIKKLEKRQVLKSVTLFALSSVYPNTIRYSLFITLYQQFEFTLTQVCIELEKDYPKGIKLTDLNHKGVTRAHTYLHKSWESANPLKRVHGTR